MCQGQNWYQGPCSYHSLSGAEKCCWSDTTEGQKSGLNQTSSIHSLGQGGGIIHGDIAGKWDKGKGHEEACCSHEPCHAEPPR